MRKLFYKLSLMSLALTLSVLSHHVNAQGVTTSTLRGVVTGSTSTAEQKVAAGELLPGANVVAVHEPSGTTYGSVTNVNGDFIIPNMRVGGPYKVTVSYIGYQDAVYENIYLSLGTAFNLSVVMAEDAMQLSEVVISSKKDAVFSSDRTGAATSINKEQINNLPTISRSLNDFARLTPQANVSGAGISFSGQNNRYNQFAIDGTVNNDVFGLSASGTNGGQTGVQPVSLDAIEEVQVVIAPYDVRLGGFTGGGINAITRSGTNKYEGSVFFFGNNQKLVGKSPDEARTPLDDYTDYQAGFRIGGPIVKDKLFFFANAEVTRRTSPLLFEPGTSSSNVTVDEIERVLSVAEGLGYDAGSYDKISDERNSEKFFARLDYNINRNHKLTLRHSYVFGEEIDNSRNPNTVRLYNNGLYFPSTTNTSVLELNSNFNGGMSNEFRVGYTTVRDDRDPLGDPFPAVNVRLGGGRTVQLGSEPFSVANELNQDVFTITNNFSLFRGNHTITFGTHNEFYKTFNLFIRQNYGAYTYNSLEDWETVGTGAEAAPADYNYSYSRTDDPQQGANFSAFQLGFYAQDEIQISSKFKVTAGLRLDIPTFNEKPSTNEAFNTAFASEGVATDKVPGAKFMLSPRVGANWDVSGDGSTQVRGGLGVFTGRAPFVWLSNQYTNTGNEFGRVFLRQAQLEANPSWNGFNADPFNQQDGPSLGLSEGISEVNVTDPNFKFPQVFRANAALDKRLPGDVIATLEAIYSKSFNNIDYKNLNKQIDADNPTLTGADKRALFSDDRPVDGFNDVILLTNTNKGYSYNLTAQVAKNWAGGLNFSAAYTYGQSKDVNGGTSSQAFSNWRFVENVNGANNTELGFSDFDARSRVVSTAGYTIKFQNESSTSVNIFYNGQSGIPLSYVYDGDPNNDGTFGNDLIFIPASKDQIRFVGTQAEQDAQWAALDSYIKGDEYLNSRRGDYAERNGARLPWTNQFDLRIMHEIKLNTAGNDSHRLQFTLDVFNVGNLINASWGRQYGVSNNSFALIEFDDYDVDGTTPLYIYDGAGLTEGNPYFVNDFNSRWRGQIGVRYIFN